MLESTFQSADTRPKPFPWGAVALVAALAFALGAACTWWWLDAGTTPRLGVLAVALGAALVGAAWALRDQVRRWAQHYGSAVEYVARRKREHEAGIRFETP